MVPMMKIQLMVGDNIDFAESCDIDSENHVLYILCLADNNQSLSRKINLVSMLMEKRQQIFFLK